MHRQPVVRSVLELGSGPGFLASHLLKVIPNLHMVLLDFSDAMHGLARRRVGSMVNQVEFLTKNFKNSDWVHDLMDFDAVVTNQAVHELRQASLAIVYHALGRNADADAALARMIEEQADENAFGIAAVYAFRRQSDESMHWLERAYAQKDPGMYYVKGDPPLESIAADPRFKAFLRKMKLPPK